MVGDTPTDAPLPRAWLHELLSKLRAGLESTYGQRLQGLFLYGSMARGDEQAGSDVDVLIVLDEVPHYFEELERTAQLVSDLSLAYDVTISRTLMSANRWRDGDEPFLTTIRQDATAA
jgi:predicted nucleotidyltransferase